MTAASRKGLTAWLFRSTRGMLPMLGLSTLARVAGALLNVALLVVAVRGLLDAARGGSGSLVALALGIVGICVAKAGLRYLEHFAGHWVAFTSLQRLRELFFSRLVPQAPAATSGRASAELTERATRDIDRIEVFFAHTFPPVIASVAVPAIALGWLGTAVDGVLAAVVAGFLALALLLPFVGARATWAAARAIGSARGRVAAHVADDVQGVREVLAFEAENVRIASLDRLQDDVGRAERRLGRAVGLRIAIEHLLRAACIVVVLLSGHPSEDIVVTIAVIFGLWFKSAGTDDFATGLDAAFAAAERVRRVVEAAPMVADTGTERLPDGDADVVLDGVTFAYPEAGSPALREVDARFAAGGWHAVVGVSGSGKSTIAALLTRSWDPEAGEIRLAGVPLPRLPLDALRSAVAVVDQRPTLFPGTLAENLRLARPEATEGELAAALEDVRLGRDALSDGLATEIGERGTTLSGGQLQRVALARALVAEPRVLVLDEALSQLDSETAEAVRSRLRSRRLTVVEITHRTDTIDAGDHVIVVDRGAVVESGRAGDLRERGRAFARLALRDAG